MSQRTLFLSKLIGLYCILVPVSLMIHRQATIESVATVLSSPALMLLLGAITVAAGLAMVLAHNVWSGGALAVIVTLIGWLTLAKGLVVLFLLPCAAEGHLLGRLHYHRLFYPNMVISLIIGVYLLYGGCVAARRS